jgi:hypothetical protein
MQVGMMILPSETHRFFRRCPVHNLLTNEMSPNDQTRGQLHLAFPDSFAS